MIQLIDKDDFPSYVEWSVNIPANKVDSHCKDAQKFDAFPIMPIAVVSNNNLITDIETAVGESPVTRPELLQFFEDFLKPYLVVNAYRRFLLWHGRNITQFGLRVNQEETSTEVSDKARAELIADTNHKTNIFLAAMTTEMNNVSYTWDSIVYSKTGNCETRNPRAKTRIIAI